ncbi:hypothetical protein SISSUDRAFT_205751 [Sistotremastrum suecicum HHB10207 ss-3]|uniref:ARM repeat-containing protein n=1 Tax=Sistotremastrum suecicum HHB10207 ss-3 TaxID=1314776 RepID=A0A166GME2_9AGAM|nr:hypothetical protein SISSUDRAFT_205751 [Sistotremastrum suecicum HHB10207 ss-3]
MLWPDNRHNEVIGNYDILDDITTLEHSASSTATRREKTMSTRVLARAGPDSPHASRILETICGNAQRWNDLELWIQTIDTLGALKRPQIMGCSAIVAGVLTFGFDALRESLEKMISNSDDVPFNLELIDAITNAAPKGAMHVQEWCQDQRAVVIQSLLKALPESMDVLHVLIKHRDHQFFADHVAPHLIAARPGFLAFVKAMHVDREDLPEPMKLFLRSQAACLVLQGVEAAQALDTERTFESIDLCLHLLDSQAFSSFLQDLASATSDRDATLPLTERNRQIYGFYSRLMRDLQLLKRRMDARGEDKEPFDGYLREVVTGFLRGPIDAMKDASEVLIMAKAFQWTDDVGRSLVKET